MLTFLLMWEGMSLTSYFLVMTEADEERTRNAGLWYIGMTHAGLVMLLAAFVLFMGGTGRARLPICGRSRHRLTPAFGTPSLYWLSSASARRRVLSHFTCGFRARIRLRPAMFPR